MGTTSSTPNERINKEVKTVDENNKKFIKNFNKEGDSDYDDEDDSFVSESFMSDLPSENRG